MKKFFSIAAALLGLAFMAPSNSQAVNLTLENYAEAVQTNECYDCGDIVQVNVTSIYQTIKVAKQWLLPDNVHQLADILNDVVLYQDNICEFCVEVLQLNETYITQYITLPTTLLYTGGPFPGYPPVFAGNEAIEDQFNFCEDCYLDDQINYSVIEQFIDLTDLYVLDASGIPNGGYLSEFSNLAYLDQLNYCYYCANMTQYNIIELYQQIKPVPEPATMVLMGSGLIGLVAWRLRKGHPRTAAS